MIFDFYVAGNGLERLASEPSDFPGILDVFRVYDRSGRDLVSLHCTASGRLLCDWSIEIVRLRGFYLTGPVTQGIQLNPKEVERARVSEVLFGRAYGLGGFADDYCTQEFYSLELAKLGIAKMIDMGRIEFYDFIRLHNELGLGSDWLAELSLFEFMLEYGLDFRGSNLADDLILPVAECSFGRGVSVRNFLQRKGIFWLGLLRHISEDELQAPAGQFGLKRLQIVKDTLATFGLALKE